MNDQLGLFNKNSHHTPLAHRSRPQELSGFVGQKYIKDRIAKVDMKNLPHIIFCGPPGCGKTTLAQILAHESKSEVFLFNAVLGGVKDLREIIKKTTELKNTQNKDSIIFIDEIHRFNKAQQDALLPHLEQGAFVFFGATTENPNTSLNKAILSRVQIWRLGALQDTDIHQLLESICKKNQIKIDSKIIEFIAQNTNGDARAAINQLETLFQNIDKVKELPVKDVIKTYLFSRRRYDKNSERHYDVISAFIKSIRGSDVNAAILWLAVMLDGGEDIEFIARRLIISASEDVGNADPRALTIATDAHYAIKQIGMPEARIILAQATTYLANAPKSNKSYLAINEALEYVKNNPTVEVPTHLRNHHPEKNNYKYPHAYKNHWVKQQYSPTDLKFYQSSQLGYEKMQDAYLSKVKNFTD